MTRYEYPIINVEAENEHFELSDAVISWIENCKSSQNECDPNALVLNLLPSQASCHQLSAPGLAWNLVGLFGNKHGFSKEIAGLNKPNENGTSESKSSSDEDDEEEEEELSSKLCQIQLVKGQGGHTRLYKKFSPDQTTEGNLMKQNSASSLKDEPEASSNIEMRGNDEWAPPRGQLIFNVHEDTSFRKLMQKQNYRCSGCGSKVDVELARRLVLYCHYLGKYFCKCCFSHKSIHLPGYILQKWDFHKYPVSHFALQFLDRIANEPLFNVNDINPVLYRKVKKLKNLVDIRTQLYYLKIYITTCPVTEKLSQEFTSFSQQHLLDDDVHLYSLNNLIEIQYGKLYEYLSDLVTRSIAHIAQCDRCRAKGHYCQLCGPSSLMSSMISQGSTTNQQHSQLTNCDQLNQQQPPIQHSSRQLKHSNSIGQSLSSSANHIISGGHSRSGSGNFSLGSNLPSPSTPINDYELIFPFEIGRVAQCRLCGCCFHLQCFLDAGQNCPKCERVQRRRAGSPIEKVVSDNTESSLDHKSLVEAT